MPSSIALPQSFSLLRLPLPDTPLVPIGTFRIILFLHHTLFSSFPSITKSTMFSLSVRDFLNAMKWCHGVVDIWCRKSLLAFDARIRLQHV